MYYRTTCQGLIQLLSKMDFGESVRSYLAPMYMVNNSSPHAQLEQLGLYLTALLPSHCFGNGQWAMYLFTRSSYLS